MYLFTVCVSKLFGLLPRSLSKKKKKRNVFSCVWLKFGINNYCVWLYVAIEYNKYYFDEKTVVRYNIFLYSVGTKES